MILLLADLHIRPNGVIYRNKPFPSGDIQYALDQITQYIEKHSPSAVILLGDVFDTPVNTSSAISIASKMKDWPNVFFVQGQHDFSEPPWLETLHIGTHLRGYREIDGLLFYGLDWISTDAQFYSIVAQLDSCDVFATHQVWGDFIPGSRIYLSRIQDASFRFLVSGDYHKPILTQINNYTFLSPGPPAVNSAAEDFESYVWFFDGTGFQSFPLKKRSVYRLSFSSVEEAETFLHKHPQDSLIDSSKPGDISKPLIHVEGPKDVCTTVAKAYPECYVLTKIVHQRDDKSEQERVSFTSDSSVVSLQHLFYRTFEEKYGLGNAVSTIISLMSSYTNTRQLYFKNLLDDLGNRLDDPRLRRFYET